MMGGYYGGPGWGGWLAMALVMLAFWALVVFAVAALFRGIGKNSGSDRRPAVRDPLDILGERFAREEIDAEEYLARREVLRGRRDAPD